MTDNAPPRRSGPRTMSRAYVSAGQIAECRICGRTADLRCDVCFDCVDFVVGKRISQVAHLLWDRRDPSNEWVYVETSEPAP